MFDKYALDWKNRVSAYSQGNKLRTYKLFKHDFCTEPYLEYKMPLKYRSAYAKLDVGLHPLEQKQVDTKEKQFMKELVYIVLTVQRMSFMF